MADSDLFDEPEIRPEVEAWLKERAAPRPAAAARYELLDGEQVALPAMTEAHAACVSRVSRLLTESVGDGALVWVQAPVRLGEDTAPCPDLALVTPRDDGYASAYPSAGDILLLIEVCDTSFGLTHSRGRKAALYASRAIPECWVVDLMSGQVLVHRSPASGGYRDIRQLRGGAALRVGALPNVSLQAESVIGSAES